MLSIGDFAKKTGLTVRALRFYEEKGLLSPPRSRDNERRFYGQAEFEQVQKIVSLKKLGLPLSEIEALLQGRRTSLLRVLSVQLEALEKDKAEVEAAIKALKSAIAALNGGDELDIQTLTKLIRMTTMTETAKREMKKIYSGYFTDEQMKELEARKFSATDQKAYQEEWKRLFDKAKTLLGTDPKRPEARALAERAQELVTLFTGGNQEIKQNLGAMYKDIDNWSGQFDFETVMGFDVKTWKEIQKFLNDALKCED